MRTTPGAGEPYALERGEGWTYAFGPNFVVKAGERGPGRRLAFVDMLTKKGEEPGDHTHPTEDEIFYLVTGAATFRCGGRTFELGEGGFMFLPRGLEHGYTITNDGPARLLIVTSPADEGASSGWGGLIGDLEG